MTFLHIPITIPKTRRIVRDGRHYYQAEDGGSRYPSITTVLGSTKDKSGIDRWKMDIGYDVADYILTRAGDIGHNTHEIIEKYLSNEEDVAPRPLCSRAHYHNLKPFLDKISDIRGLEIPLYSDKLKLAGTADCIAVYEGKLSIIDFKTSLKNKREEWIEDYFLQGSAYAQMWEYLANEEVNQVVILMSSEQDQKQAFIKNTKDYESKLFERVTNYYANLQ